MTERGRKSIARSRDAFVIGPSAVRWEADALVIDIAERGMPVPQALRGRVRVFPSALGTFVTQLDDANRHRWGPIAACARVEVELQRPWARWRGHAYFDANEGDEPVERAFEEWDWSRSLMRDGSTAVLYDVRQKRAADRVLALRFAPSGAAATFEAPQRQRLPRTLWQIDRTIRTEAGMRAHVVQTLEDTPFYARAVLSSGLLGERVTTLHETLNVPRLASAAVQLMLPWRMPRVP